MKKKESMQKQDYPAFRSGLILRALLPLIFFLPSVILLISCDQAHIFYSISEEEEPKDPRVAGSPTAIVDLGEKSVYVAHKGGGTIHQYSNDAWSTVSAPGGTIMELAATEGNIYALTEGAGIRRLEETGWNSVSLGAEGAGYTPVSIYGAGDTLFAGAWKSEDNTYAVFYGGTGAYMTKLPADTGLLQGAAKYGVNYYVATGKGLFVIDGAFQATLAKADGADVSQSIVGVLALEGKGVVATRRDGPESCYLLFGKDANGFTVSNKKELTFTGALAVWKAEEAGENKLLLLGIQGRRDTTVHGYRELSLNDDGTVDVNGELRTPGNNAVTTVEDHYKYDNGVGKYPVLSILQVSPGLGGVIFASTSKNGLYSYRNGTWNAEE